MMKLWQRILALAFALLFCVMPMASCAEEKKPTEEEKKTEEVKTKEEETKEEISIILKDVEVDPLFYDQDPTEDGELNLLMIGNSYSYYWLDELWGLLNAAGYENVRICDVYYSGCTFEKHWTWYENSERNYTYFQIYEGLERKAHENVGLEECMSYANWDYIGFQQSGTYMYGGGVENGLTKFKEAVLKHLPQLYRLMYQNFPQAKFFWVQHWVHEVGTSDKGGTSEMNQKIYYQAYKSFAQELCPTYHFTNVPLGDAWQAVRHDPIFYEAGKGDYPIKTLHTRLYNGENQSYEEIRYDDLSHDGDIGGGQYLNACVWFEIISHQSVVGNSFRPSYIHTQDNNKVYTLSEEQIGKLQNAAHEAVLGCHGEGWYQ